VAAFAVGILVSSAAAVAGWVTNASLNVGVGVVVASITKGLIVVGVCVTTTAGIGDKVGIPPGGVGVAYCPHRDAFPPQEASKKEATMKKLINRFTKLSAAGNYTFIN
jgi:hypothetical protein